MKRIASFCVDHDRLEKGMYVSRTDGGVVTYDIRMKRPNGGDYLSTGTAHTLEHLFATFARNSGIEDKVIYVGPMGCRTGFYLLLSIDAGREEALRLTQEAMAWIATYEGDIPGASRKECGNYKDQDLDGARAVAADMVEVLKGWAPAKMLYNN